MKFFASGFVYIGGVRLRTNEGFGFMGLCKVGTCRRHLRKAHVFLKKKSTFLRGSRENWEYGFF